MIVYLLNILLVDDEKDTLRIIQKYFESKGANVSAYSEALLALQDFIKNQNSKDVYYDLVISDIKMPEMNGIELASIITKMNKEIPIIFMTASDMIDINNSILKFLNRESVIANL
jgi:CheY-like chemotaxis protein